MFGENSRTEARKRFNDHTNVGAVIVFREGITEEQAKLALEQIRGLLAHEPQVHGFNAEWGSPVWYIP